MHQTFEEKIFSFKNLSLSNILNKFLNFGKFNIVFDRYLAKKFIPSFTIIMIPLILGVYNYKISTYAFLMVTLSFLFSITVSLAAFSCIPFSS